MSKHHTFKDFSTELSYYSGKDNYEKWIAFLEELGIYADYYWDLPSMQYSLVKSDKEWADFLSHPERQPFKISVREWQDLTIEDLYPKVLEIIAFSLTLYNDKKLPKDIRQQIKLSISQAIKGIVHSRYDKYLMELEDSYVGITPQMRANADLQVTPIHQTRFEYFTKVAAEELGQNVEHVRKLLLDACQNDLARLTEYFMTCQFSDELKAIIVAYRRASSSDHTLDDLSIHVGFRIWKELMDHGVDINNYLELLSYPSTKIVSKRLLDLIKNKEVTKEIHQHLKNERPKSYAKLKKYGFVLQIDLTQEEAEINDYPTQLRSEKKTTAMIDKCRNIIKQYFPLSSEESPRQLMFNAIHPFATKRAFQSQTQNSNKQSVNITVMTPPVDSENDYLETLAHETTHAIHSIILHRAVEFNVITMQQANQVPTSVLEDFSQLVEGQFTNNTQSSHKSIPGKYFTSLNQALGSRAQAPFGLIQIGIREYFEKIYRQGITKVSPEMIVELRNEYTKKLRDWQDNELRFIRPVNEPFVWFAPIAPYDGLVYMKRFILPQKKQKSSSKKEGLTMNDALVKRFGQKWIDAQDARILLYWLLLETGRNHATENYGELITKKDIRECLEELQKIGISATEFSQKK